MRVTILFRFLGSGSGLSSVTGLSCIWGFWAHQLKISQEVW
jgi:hypothetical protein